MKYKQHFVQRISLVPKCPLFRTVIPRFTTLLLKIADFVIVYFCYTVLLINSINFLLINMGFVYYGIKFGYKACNHVDGLSVA